MNSALLCRLALVLSLSVSLGQAQNLEPAPGAKAAAKPLDPSLVDVPDVPGLPRVLLIGDSISMGYTLGVRAKLKGVANVHHPAENCGPTERGLARLDTWLGTNHWDVIHFNLCGSPAVKTAPAPGQRGAAARQTRHRAPWRNPTAVQRSLHAGRL